MLEVLQVLELYLVQLVVIPSLIQLLLAAVALEEKVIQLESVVMVELAAVLVLKVIHPD